MIKIRLINFRAKGATEVWKKPLVKRIMPHSLEAEQSVIGSMIMDRDAILTASEQLVKDEFLPSAVWDFV